MLTNTSLRRGPKTGTGMKTATVEDGTTVKLGDWVGFKCDHEQSGRIVSIETERTWTGTHVVLVLAADDCFGGDYIGGDTTTRQYAEDCWAYASTTTTNPTPTRGTRP